MTEGEKIAATIVINKYAEAKAMVIGIATPEEQVLAFNLGEAAAREEIYKAMANCFMREK